MPKMSFGTGHHQTTWLASRALFDLDLKNKNMLDMGTGTGILAILAEKLGAASIFAPDIDTWSFENAKKIVLQTLVPKLKLHLAALSFLQEKIFTLSWLISTRMC
jgi:ribosomal protein L11 methyltransferase